MKRRSFLATCAYSLLIGASGALQTEIAQSKDNVVGTIWSYTLTRNNKKESGQFRMYNLEIFKGEEKVGVCIRKVEDEVKLIITKYPPLNGTAFLLKVRKNPPLWKGMLTKADGSKWQMESTIKEQ